MNIKPWLLGVSALWVGWVSVGNAEESFANKQDLYTYVAALSPPMRAALYDFDQAYETFCQRSLTVSELLYTVQKSSAFMGLVQAGFAGDGAGYLNILTHIECSAPFSS
mgnify:CR=1 FL=1